MLSLPRRLEVRAIFGNAELDFSDVQLPPGVTELVIRATFGNVEIRLPPGVVVENLGGGVLGSFTCRGGVHAHGAADVPVVRIVGRALLANVEVEVRSPPSRWSTAANDRSNQD